MCELTSGFGALNCDTSGGVEKWFIQSIGAAPSGEFNYTYTRTAGEITAMTNDPGKVFYEILVDAEFSDFTVASIGSRENASTGFSITGNIKLAGNSAANIQQFENLVKDRVCLIAKLNDGSFEVLGIDKGLKFTLSRTSGTKYEDFNGVTLTFEGRETKNAPKISSAIVDTLLV